ncbi:hypothetical protein N8T08_002230 [Aspergillus melleus]|uniref:Uncharacterized protein n=1 Tax=Aspergillus melleus TaxID=138277 RepID=A0ACC3B8V6_9EURO|nr:hypothetical protein N8T08_002230 [Aspergillus melleus]
MEDDEHGTDQESESEMGDDVEKDKNERKPRPIFSLRILKFYAQLYIFATKYLYEELRECARHYIWEILEEDINHRKNAPDYLDFLSYVFAHTSCTEPGGNSLLRFTVVSFISDYLTYADDEVPFEELFLSGGEITRDVVYSLLETVNDTRKKTGK